MALTKSGRIRDNWLSYTEIAVIIILALMPLFIQFPYRVNIFLSWEGAYRLSQGEVPYRDFGMPLGYMYWVIPSIFFKIFGAQLITLVKAQVLINILSGLAFRYILKYLRVQTGIRFLSVLVFCISFSFFNFWPWYNHTVIVYQFIGLAFLLRYISSDSTHWIWLSLAAAFGFFSFFTKQDAGAMAIFLSIALLCCHCLSEKTWKPLLVYIASLVIVGFALIAPFLQYNFSYWFNVGQPPHTARFSVYEIISEFFLTAQWIKFYILLIIILALSSFRSRRDLLKQKTDLLFLVLTLGILAEASVLQVTSYTPPDNNIFYHSFAFAYIFSNLNRKINLDFSRPGLLFAGIAGLLLWWSGTFWGYLQRITDRLQPKETATSATGENIVNRKTYVINPVDSSEIPVSEWRFSSLRSFEGIYMPAPTAEGMERVMDLTKNQQRLKVLNMSELTPLAAEIPYETEKGPEIPLWHHLGVGMFNKEASEYENKIRQKHYDLVLFEYIPRLNNFFPFRTREVLQEHYRKIDSFPAPRRGDTQGIIEVFAK